MEQTYLPNVGVGATRGWCLKYIDDAGNAPTRTATAKIAYQNEANAGRIRGDTTPDGVWVVGFLSFTTGPYVQYGHVFFIKRNSSSYEIRDSETNGGGRGVYRSINELLAWFGAYNPKYLGWSTHCDGREYARVKQENTEGRKPVNNDDLNHIYIHGPLRRGRSGNEGSDVYLGKSAAFVLADHANSTEGRNKKASIDNAFAQAARIPELEKKLAEKPKEVIVEKPVEVIKEIIKEVPVEKVVEKEVVREVVKGDESRTAWELIASGLSKLFGGKK